LDKAQIWFCCLAVLNCPMSVKDKIQTLKMALLDEVGDRSFMNVPETGLKPFDAAVKNYAAKLIQDIEND
jgi:hypothetical protein